MAVARRPTCTARGSSSASTRRRTPSPAWASTAALTHSVAVGSLGHETHGRADVRRRGASTISSTTSARRTATGSRSMRDALRADRTCRSSTASTRATDTTTSARRNRCSLDLRHREHVAHRLRHRRHWGSVIRLIDENAALSSYAGPGHWNDPDMLEVGNGLTDTEGRAHFSMWAIMAAPLIAGNDLRSMSAATKTTLTNAEVIAVDQDPLGDQGQLVASPAANLQVWSKTLSGTNIRAVALFNRGIRPRRSPCSGAHSVFPPAPRPSATSGATPIWATSPAPTRRPRSRHGVVMLKVTSSP